MKTTLKGLIPAAGKGLRLYPYTHRTAKTLLNIDGVPILQRNIELMRDSLGIHEIYIIIGYKKSDIRTRFGNGEKLGVKIEYIEVQEVEKGLADGILSAENYFQESAFCVILGDELYYNSNHKDLLKMLDTDFSAVCAIKEVNHSYIIRKNYSVEIEAGLITSLVEKPEEVKNNFLGCGTYLFKPDIFKYIRSTPASTRSKRIELIDVINLMAKKEGKVRPFMLSGNYINVNNIDDYNAANCMLRSVNFKSKKTSLIIPAYNEALSIGHVIDDFKGKVDEIVVVNNNSRDDTEKIAKEKGARVLTGSFKGYGAALKFGMDNAAGDIFILTEADGSFFSRDLGKILEYLKDSDMALGTRTTKQMIEQAANMNFLLRWGNVTVAKLIELLWLSSNEPRLTDVGCTYRGIWKSAYREIRDCLNGPGTEFSPEMIIEAIRHNKRVIEIPVTYSGRIGGESKFSSNIFANAKTAVGMLKLIFRKKTADILQKYFKIDLRE
jgi:UDP-N-acetylglucosamine diphosphorylase / glucose-1-phosphate thymidylyltransferase / UDP-N-acetylgalactosamine diphosphorylase / glucosamine-1-phosphate N-acetyltransferase / galactosamine-1-phosphate N-acetyltransferase